MHTCAWADRNCSIRHTLTRASQSWTEGRHSQQGVDDELIDGVVAVTVGLVAAVLAAAVDVSSILVVVVDDEFSPVGIGVGLGVLAKSGGWFVIVFVNQ